MKCTHYNRGYCQFRDKCRNKHPKEVCDDENCENVCDKRHPNPCKFGHRCTFLKKKICLYSHVTFASDDGKIKEVNKKLNKKIENLDKKMEGLQSNLNEKDLEISELKQKFKDLEKIVHNFGKEIGEVEERVIDATKSNETFLNQSISVLEGSFKLPEKVIFKCEQCNFETESEKGLKVHFRRKHVDVLDIPQTCDFCEMKCFNKQNLEDHLKKHSYRELKYKCEDCDFLVEDILSLDVHVERKHSGNFKCVICGFSEKDEEHLNTHLHTCETFTCDYCFPDRVCVKNLPDLIKHLKIKHEKHLKTTTITHTKMDRNNIDKVSQNKVKSSYLINTS